MSKNPNIEIHQEVGLSGHFTIYAESKARGRRKLAEFNNLILDIGLDRLGVTSAQCAAYCRVGSGTTTPATSQTALVSQVAAVSNLISSLDTYYAGPPPYIESVLKYRFNEGTATGTLAEVGVGWASTGSTLFCRARILDTGGNPTTITVLSDEALDVEYRFRLYPPTTDVTGSVTIASVSYSYTLRAGLTNTSTWSPQTLLNGGFGNGSCIATNGSIGSITGSPSGSTAAGSGSAAVYTNGNYYRDATFTWGLTSGNFSSPAGISAIAWSRNGTYFQVGFATAIPKDGTKVFTFTVRNSWARRP